MFAEPPTLPSAPPSPVSRAGLVNPVWHRWDPLIGVGILIGSLVFIWVLVALVVIGFDPTGAAEDYVLAVLGVAYELMFAGWVLLLANRRRINLTQLGFRRPDRWGPIGIAVVGAYGSLLGWGAFVTMLDQLGVDVSWIEGSNEIPIDEGIDTAPLIGLLILFGIAVVVVAPLAEELLFRGLLFRGLDGVWPGWAAIVVSGLAFGAFHLNLPVLVPFSLIGMIFAWAYKASGSLWVTIGAHFIVNSVSFIVTVIGVFT